MNTITDTDLQVLRVEMYKALFVHGVLVVGAILGAAQVF